MDKIVDSLWQFYATSPLLSWVLGSVLVYILATNVLWLTKASGFHRAAYGHWLVQVGRFLFYVGIPYLALGGWPREPYQGLLSLEDMGLVGLNSRWPVTRWLEALGAGTGLGLLASLILIVAWVGANRVTATARLSFPPRSFWVILVDVLYLELHWAYYRGAMAVALDDLYAGVLSGVGLVYLEWGLNPFWRQGWRQRTQVAERWLRAALVLVVAVLFLFTRNVWVCLAVHGLVECTFRWLGRGKPWSSDARAPRAL
jgi:hypothetical protein